MASNAVDHISLVEVAARDGLQHEREVLSISARSAFIDALSKTGLTHIEVGSFVSPKAIPQLANTDKVFQTISRVDGIEYSALVPNMQGYQVAAACNMPTVSVFTSPSETFCQHNIGCSVAESMERFKPVFTQAKLDGRAVRAYISCVFACPYEGVTNLQSVIALAAELLDLGASEISLGDTIGVGTAKQTRTLLQALASEVPANQLAVHFHNTYGQALTNMVEAFNWGIRTVDSAVAGLGGCPYARGASGNVATEDVLYCCEGLGLHTGVDLDKLLLCDDMICQALGVNSRSAVAQARLK